MSLQVLINGIATGSIYALIATGFALIFNILKFSNFSHGATMTAAAFIAYFLVSSKGMGLVPTLLTAALAGAVISLFGEFVGFRRILKNHSAPTYFFVSSITLGTLYEGLVTIKAGSNFFPQLLHESHRQRGVPCHLHRRPDDVRHQRRCPAGAGLRYPEDPPWPRTARCLL